MDDGTPHMIWGPAGAMVQAVYHGGMMAISLCLPDR